MNTLNEDWEIKLCKFQLKFENIVTDSLHPLAQMKLTKNYDFVVYLSLF